MDQKKQFNAIIISLVAIVVLLLASNIFVYIRVEKDIAASQKLLQSGINQEKNAREEQLSLLENKTISNFNALQELFGSETTKLKLDLNKVKTQTETGLKDITQKVGGLEEKSQELESKISNLDVTSSDFSSIAAEVIKSVVSVKTDKGQGSGVIFDREGYVMTNKHVIEDASSVYVVDYDYNKYPVSIVGTASNVDLAVLKIEYNKTFDYLDFADSSDIRVGQRVIAVGNPLGLSFSVTEGIISSVNRVVDSTGIGYIQTDVPINAGNSGGPLINSNSKIVGINTFKLLDTEGLGFAIPADAAESIAEQAVK